MVDMEAASARHAELVVSLADHKSKIGELRSLGDRFQNIPDEGWTDEDLMAAEALIEVMVEVVTLIQDGNREVAELEFLLAGSPPVLVEGAL